MGYLLVSRVVGCRWDASWDRWQARLHNSAKSGHVLTLLTALAVHLRREPIEFAVETVRGRGEQMVAPLAVTT